MGKIGKAKNGNNKAKHTKLLNQKKKRVQDAKIQNKIRLKDIINRSKIQLQDCPCGLGENYKECCEIIHLDITKANTAEQLMRSRYSAFALANIDYLILSHHSKTNPLDEKQEILAWAKSVKWQKLEIINSSIDTVEFKAYFKENDVDQLLHENSQFEKENNTWKYLDKVR